MFPSSPKERISSLLQDGPPELVLFWVSENKETFMMVRISSVFSSVPKGGIIINRILNLL